MKQKVTFKSAGLVLLGLLAVAGVLFTLSKVKAERDPILSFNPPGYVLPCVLGVTPGETDIDKAIAIMRSYPQLREINAVTFEFEGKQGQGRVILKQDDPRRSRNVYMVNIYTYAYPDYFITTLGTLIDRYGTPEQTFRGRVAGPNAVSLLTTFENGSILAIISAVDEVGPNSEITYLGIIDPDDVEWGLSEVRVTQHYDDEVTWLGYTSTDEYWQQ